MEKNGMIAIDYSNLILVKDGMEVSILARVHRPEAKNGDYRCHVEFKNFGIKIERDIFGVTQAQALLLATKLVSSLIISSREFSQGSIFLIDPEGEREVLTPAMIGADLLASL